MDSARLGDATRILTILWRTLTIRVIRVPPNATTPFFVVLKDIRNRQVVKDWRVFKGKREVGAKLDRGIHDVDDVDNGHDRGRSDGGGKSDCDDRNSGGRGAVRRGAVCRGAVRIHLCGDVLPSRIS
jgi:hypothetical protein